jgi:hypothetical protein
MEEAAPAARENRSDLGQGKFREQWKLILSGAEWSQALAKPSKLR